MTSAGYPAFGGRNKEGKKAVFLAHRYSYELANGPIQGGMLVLHRCDTPLCVRPTHLFLGTDADNAADKVAKGRHTWGERNGSNVLTAEEVLEIRKRYTKHGPRRSNIKQLAAEYGVKRSTAYNAAVGRTWPHLRQP